jgi:hypothetical protein
VERGYGEDTNALLEYLSEGSYSAGHYTQEPEVNLSQKMSEYFTRRQNDNSLIEMEERIAQKSPAKNEYRDRLNNLRKKINAIHERSFNNYHEEQATSDF